MTQSPDPSPDAEILRAWGLSLARRLDGGYQNLHWLVRTASGGERVLRRYKENRFGDLPYEYEVMRRLHGMGWPVPEVTAQRVDDDGVSWCLMTRLPGAVSSESGKEEERRRGRMLAEFHLATKDLVDMGQRRGFVLPDQLASDPDLHAGLKRYEALRPAEGYLLRWHLERAAGILETLDVAGAEKLVLHGDFVGRNLLFEDGRLSGIVDFEATHLNVRVADFALSWRGCRDEVVHGYETVHPLSELDRQLLVPIFWTWLFIGVKDLLESRTDDELRRLDFAWQIKQLSRRSPLFGDLQAPFAGRA